MLEKYSAGSNKHVVKSLTAGLGPRLVPSLIQIRLSKLFQNESFETIFFHVQSQIGLFQIIIPTNIKAWTTLVNVDFSRGKKGLYTVYFTLKFDLKLYYHCFGL